MKPKMDKFMEEKKTLVQANSSAKAAFLESKTDDAAAATGGNPEEGVNLLYCSGRHSSCLYFVCTERSLYSCYAFP